MLSLAKILAVPPRLLVADELSLGLAPVVVDAVYEGLLAIRDQGCALLVVEQQIDRVLAIADRALLLAKGAVAWEGPAADAEAAMERLLAAGSLADAPMTAGSFTDAPMTAESLAADAPTTAHQAPATGSVLNDLPPPIRPLAE